MYFLRTFSMIFYCWFHRWRSKLPRSKIAHSLLWRAIESTWAVYSSFDSWLTEVEEFFASRTKVTEEPLWIGITEFTIHFVWYVQNSRQLHALEKFKYVQSYSYYNLVRITLWHQGQNCHSSLSTSVASDKILSHNGNEIWPESSISFEPSQFPRS